MEQQSDTPPPRTTIRLDPAAYATAYRIVRNAQEGAMTTKPKISRLDPRSVTLAELHAVEARKPINAHFGEDQTLYRADPYLVPSNSGKAPHEVLRVSTGYIRCDDYCRSWIERQTCHHVAVVEVYEAYEPLARLARDYTPAMLAQWHGEVAERLRLADAGLGVEPVAQTIGALRACEGALAALGEVAA